MWFTLGRTKFGDSLMCSPTYSVLPLESSSQKDLLWPSRLISSHTAFTPTFYHFSWPGCSLSIYLCRVYYASALWGWGLYLVHGCLPSTWNVTWNMGAQWRHVLNNWVGEEWMNGLPANHAIWDYPNCLFNCAGSEVSAMGQDLCTLIYAPPINPHKGWRGEYYPHFLVEKSTFWTLWNLREVTQLANDGAESGA